jgi:hypothetical protein
LVSVDATDHGSCGPVSIDGDRCSGTVARGGQESTTTLSGDFEMSSENTDTEPLDSETITKRFGDLEPGDRLSVNNHELTYEVIDTDTYSVIAEDPTGHRVTFSQNLQTGGWSVSEEIFTIDTDTE